MKHLAREIFRMVALAGVALLFAPLAFGQSVHIAGVLGNDNNDNQCSIVLDLVAGGHSISYGCVSGVENPGIVSVEVMHHDPVGALSFDGTTWRHEATGGPGNPRIMVTAFTEDGRRFFELGLGGTTEVSRDANGDCILSFAIDTSGTAIETELGVTLITTTDRVIGGNCVTEP